jgi:hypothetical protein
MIIVIVMKICEYSIYNALQMDNSEVLSTIKTSSFYLLTLYYCRVVKDTAEFFKIRYTRNKYTRTYTSNCCGENR